MGINRQTYALSKAYTDKMVKEHLVNTNYDDLKNRPQINGITLTGNKTGADLGLATTYAVEQDTLIIQSN